MFLAIIVMIGLFESPRYLVSRSRYEEAKMVVEKVANKARTKVEVKLVSQDFSKKTEGRSLVENLKSEFSGLWSHEFKEITAIYWFTWFSIVFTEFAITLWLPTILIRTGVSTGLAFICNMIIESINIPGPFLVAYLIEKTGRKNLAALALMGYGLSLILWNSIIGSTLSLVVGVGLIMRLFMEMSFSTMYIYTAEVYPTKVRSSGLGWAIAVGRLGGLIGSMTLPALWSVLGLSRVFLIPAALCILSSPLIFFIGTETKGKPLRDDAKPYETLDS
jgi:putative MFS transporter